MPDYSFTPQFANLSGLQPLQPIDVTRGGALQFQPLQQVQVLSSRPELVSQAIAGAVQNIGQGALSGITARWEKEEAKEAEQRKYAHELELAGAKKKSEDLDFAQKELLKFDIAHSGDADYPERRKQVEEALTGRVAAVVPKTEPSTSIKKAQEESDTQYQTQQDPRYKKALLEVQGGDLQKQIQKVDAETPLPEIPVQPTAPLAEVKPITPKEETKPLTEVSVPTAKQTQVSEQPPSVDKVPLPEPDITGERFSSREAALAAKKQTETNPHWDIKVVGPDNKGYFHLETESKFKEVTGVQKQERDDWYKQQDLKLKQQEAERKSQEAEEKSGKITKANAAQYKTQVDQASASVREINDLIKLIKENPTASVGGWSKPYSLIPGNNAAKIARGLIKTIHSNVAFNALMELKKASPTGGSGLGSLTEGEREALSSTEGSFDLDNLPAEYILPRLEQLKNARLKLIDIAGKQIQKVDPEFEAPSISYKSSKPKKAIESEEQITQSIPIVKSQSDYDKLEIGSKYIFDGKELTKSKK